MGQQLQIALHMKSTYCLAPQRDNVVYRHVRTPGLGVDGIYGFPVRPSGSSLFKRKLSKAHPLHNLGVMPLVLQFVVQLEAIRVLLPSLPQPFCLAFQILWMALSISRSVDPSTLF